MTHPSRPLRAAALAALLLGAPLPLAAQGYAALVAKLQEVRRLTQSGGDRARAVAIADSLAVHYPHHPTVTQMRAVAYASAGRSADAAEQVRRLLHWDPRWARRTLADSTLAPVRSHFDSTEIARLVERADRPVARAHVLAVLAERDLVPEGTAWDPATRSVLLGSLNKHKIVAIGPDGVVSDRVPRGTSGLRSVAGIHVDARRGVLWATSNARYDTPTDSTPSMLYAFDAATGAFRGRYAPAEERRRFLNDITTGPDGAVYVTDSEAGRVLVLRPGAARLDPFAPVSGLAYVNGITISDDGRHLFVAAIDRILVVPLGGGASWALTVPDSFSVGGIDGLAFASGALVTHQPLAAGRLARYPLDAARRAIVGREVIEANTPDVRTSTTGEVAGGHYVFIGNSQLDRMNERALDSTRMDPVRIYRVALGGLQRGGMVAVALSGRDSVALFDAQSLDRVATFPAGRNPHEIAASPDGSRAYVANRRDRSITVIEGGRSPRVAATWRWPDSVGVHDVAVSDDGRTVWGTSGAERVVLELDAASGRVKRRLPVARAGGWMIEAGGPDRTLVVSHLEGGAVTLLDAATGRERVLEAREGEIDAAPSPGGGEVWSVNLRDGNLTVFDARSGREVSRQRVGPGAERVAFTRDGRLGLVVSDGDSTVTALDPRTKARLGSVVVPGGPKVIALSPDGRRAYLSHPDRGALTMIDLGSMTVLRTVPLPGTPDGVAVLEPRVLSGGGITQQ